MESNTHTCIVEETKPHELLDVFTVDYPGDKVTVKLNQKDYDAAEPTWFSLTFVNYVSYIPEGVNLTYNYITSVVESTQEVVFEYKGKKFDHLLVDQICKDPTKKKGFTLTIESQTQQP